MALLIEIAWNVLLIYTVLHYWVSYARAHALPDLDT